MLRKSMRASVQFLDVLREAVSEPGVAAPAMYNGPKARQSLSLLLLDRWYAEELCCICLEPCSDCYICLELHEMAPFAGWTLLLLLVVWTHVFLTPFTQVEESFNVQAMHDMLEFGSDLGKYDHQAFPGVVPRTFLGGVLLQQVYQSVSACKYQPLTTPWHVHRSIVGGNHFSGPLLHHASP